MALLQKTRRLLEKLKAEASKGKVASCEETLVEIKLYLTSFAALPPRYEKTPTAAEELVLARECLEQAVVVSVQANDEQAFERNYLQLNTYYTDIKDDVIPASQQMLLLKGLNLLRLLVQNRIAEFHTELETIEPHVQNSSEHIKYVIQLEQSHMEGAYNKILDSSKSCPSPLYVSFAEKLIETVRDEICACSEEAYESLSLAEARQVMRFDTEEGLLAYAKEAGWVVKDGRVFFAAAEASTDKVELNSMDLIKNTLHYAKEIERIV